MQFLNETNRPHQVSDISDPMVFRHYWAFDGHMLDFRMQEMSYIERSMGSTVSIDVNGLIVEVPSSWFIVAVSKETSTVDSVPVPLAAAYNHHALLFSAEDSKPATLELKITGINQKGVVHYPSVNKGCALIVPCMVNQYQGRPVYYGFIMGPHDLHRYVGGKTIGDLLT
jgi:hypothetical protein